MLRRNVLIFHLGGLGDFVLTWPFAVAMGRIYPQSRIIYITHRQKGLLAEKVLRLESRDAEAGWHGLFAQGGQLPPPAHSLLESAHSIYTFLPVNDSWQQNIERINPSCKRIAIDSKPSEDFTGHMTDWVLQSLVDLKVERSATEQIMRSINERGIGYKIAGGQDIVMHPGSGGVEKCWPLPRWLALAKLCKAAGRNVRWILGEVERERWPATDINQLATYGEIRHCETYLQLLQELETASVFIGNDSGPGHLAGILNVPTVSLFGPTDPLRWRPLGPRVKTLRQFEPAEVFATACSIG